MQPAGGVDRKNVLRKGFLFCFKNVNWNRAAEPHALSTKICSVVDDARTEPCLLRTGTSYSLVYVPGAVAVTDVPMSCAGHPPHRTGHLPASLASSPVASWVARFVRAVVCHVHRSKHISRATTTTAA